VAPALTPMGPADAAGGGAPILTDALVIGAGPVGLFQVFQLGLQEIRAHVVDTLVQAGGQCIELYPDKPIYDIPALPSCTGRELTERLLQQAAPFQAGFHFGQEVTRLHKRADGLFDAQTSAGTAFRCQVIVLAGGVGAFQPRKLKLEGLAPFEGRQVHYHPAVEPGSWAGADVVIVSGDELGVQAAIDLAVSRGPRSVTLLHRRAALQAPPACLSALQSACNAGLMRFTVGPIMGIDVTNHRLTKLHIAPPDGDPVVLPVDHLLVYQGLSPRLGPLAHWGLGLDRKQVAVDTEKFETNIPGVYAVGDINIYPGKQRLILSGFHEATLAAIAAGGRVHPGRRQTLEYTTSSARLHRLLGVAGAPQGL
jgi:thioredoxin reductase (NADPH)